MVFGGRRRNMASTGKIKAPAVNRKKYIKEEDLSDCRENHCGGHGMFDEDPEYCMWLEEPDPIVIDFEDQFRHEREEKASCGFREVSKSFGGQTCHPPAEVVLEHFHTAWPDRLYGSESCLVLASSFPSLSPTDCPCEMVQGVHSRKTCQKMELAIPDTCCFTCGSDWSLEHTALACFECGGYGSFRPCGQCDGKCGETWHRDLKLTHVTGVANWMGQCRLQTDTEQSPDQTSLLVTHQSVNKVVPMRA